MYSLADARIKVQRPIAVENSISEVVNRPAQRQFVDIACGLLVDYFELAWLFGKKTEFNLSRRMFVRDFAWTPGAIFDSLQFRSARIRWTQDGSIIATPCMSEAEWLFLLDQAWIDVVEIKNRADMEKIVV